MTHTSIFPTCCKRIFYFMIRCKQHEDFKPIIN
nr:MAG TPA: hypothetical protein [Caudoviricetes sp.]